MKRLPAALLAALAISVHAEEDQRQFVQMPPAAQAVLRAEMIDMQLALHEIVGLLAAGKAKEAAAVAEGRIGNGARGTRHVGQKPGQMPGRHMPETMRQLAWGMHAAGSEFAEIAQGGDAGKALAALPKITGSCVACHATFRTR
jgi:hypothetical protein